nr:bis(5'-nucleosyl)-tetraphosphatase, symmetrical [Quercus suber]
MRSSQDQEQSLSERRAELLQHRSGNRVLSPSSSTDEPHSKPLPERLPFTRAQKPLIENVTNSWRDVKRAPDGKDDDKDDDPRIDCLAIAALVKSKRIRRMLAVVLGVLVLSYYVWKRTLMPHFLEAHQINEGFLMGKSGGSYGAARGGDFEGTRIRDLNASLIPGNPMDVHHERRLVFVGDIHGCINELLTLLKKVDFDEEHDHLIAVGDVVSKGPDNLAVLDELIRLRADSVRGNHEDRLIVMAKNMIPSGLTSQDQASSTSKGTEKDSALLGSMKPHHIHYLRNMPLMLRIAALPHAAATRASQSHIANEIMVVHAGLVPHVPLAKQDPYFVMNMRLIDHLTHVPYVNRTDRNGRGKPWYKIWNWYNERVSRGKSMRNFIRLAEKDEGQEVAQIEPPSNAIGGWFGTLSQAIFGTPQRNVAPQVVIYGHDSRSGLQIHRWSKGLDSGCVSGGALTALVLDARGQQEIISVDSSIALWERFSVRAAGNRGAQLSDTLFKLCYSTSKLTAQAVVLLLNLSFTNLGTRQTARRIDRAGRALSKSQSRLYAATSGFFSNDQATKSDPPLTESVVASTLDLPSCNGIPHQTVHPVRDILRLVVTAAFEVANGLSPTKRPVLLTSTKVNPIHTSTKVNPISSRLQGALVFNCTPCHFLISCPSTLFTNRCCLITGRPANWEDTISSANIEPQPPEMSWTCFVESSRQYFQGQMSIRAKRFSYIKFLRLELGFDDLEDLALAIGEVFWGFDSAAGGVISIWSR